ncbi:asparagine synthetase B [Ammoniphilus oxalaticus]|uniref:asparagine synthase (glutamine-hydrolyzing) n=1 Tax=Ammoniphilus oxalaticus TaxID=66863 RepID=A0A419SHD8_9BACL|nr:asparagine synthase-related protein [Ammoniphilus oxalaticus]RKD23183.1 asparagine synthetase B [Ammoniphilus oxalaticus]
MSAITGIYNINDEPIQMEQGRKLMQALERFPADDASVWHSHNVFFGCHAQWITPESVGELLPYYDSERQLAITADAIIDNREELFERLGIKRDRRKTMTDSELILLSYSKWGEESPKYLIGDFAYMIWDEKKQQLFGARDLSGYRTLYYYRDNVRFAFCTTIEPLLSLPYVEKKLNEEWLAEYLAITGPINTASESTTPYKNVDQIPPSHSFVVRGNHIKLTRYGFLNARETLKFKSNEEYVEAFQEVFQEAVISRLRARRKIGAQLSGGLDSGAVVGFAARALRDSQQKIHTFSYIPPKDFVDFTPNYMIANETPYIQSTVQYVGGIIPHYLDFKGRDSYTEIDSYLDVMEMPYKFFENSFWIKGIFEAAAEQGIGILLNGDRGNFTVSWGSTYDYYASLLKRVKWVRLFQELHQFSSKVGGPRLGRLPIVAGVAFPKLEQMLSPGSGWRLPSMINPDFANKSGVYDRLQEYGINRKKGWVTDLGIYREREIFFERLFPWNTGNALTTKLSLRYGLWKRDPTNDARVVRFCLSVPEEQYVQNGMDRALIRQSTKGYLPDEVRLNQTVKGVQGADWVYRMIPFWNKFLKEAELLTQDGITLQYLNGEVIKSALEKARQGPKIELATDPEYKLLVRSVIVYRFMKKFT